METCTFTDRCTWSPAQPGLKRRTAFSKVKNCLIGFVIHLKPKKWLRIKVRSVVDSKPLLWPHLLACRRAGRVTKICTISLHTRKAAGMRHHPHRLCFQSRLIASEKWEMPINRPLWSVTSGELAVQLISTQNFKLDVLSSNYPLAKIRSIPREQEKGQALDFSLSLYRALHNQSHLELQGSIFP